MNERDYVWCVGWDHENAKLIVATYEDLKNHNANCLLDGKPGIALVRDSLTKHRAESFAAICPIGRFA